MEAALRNELNPEVNDEESYVSNQGDGDHEEEDSRVVDAHPGEDNVQNVQNVADSEESNRTTVVEVPITEDILLDRGG